MELTFKGAAAEETNRSTAECQVEKIALKRSKAEERDRGLGVRGRDAAASDKVPREPT